MRTLDVPGKENKKCDYEKLCKYSNKILTSKCLTCINNPKRLKKNQSKERSFYKVDNESSIILEKIMVCVVFIILIFGLIFGVLTIW